MRTVNPVVSVSDPVITGSPTGSEVVKDRVEASGSGGWWGFWPGVNSSVSRFLRRGGCSDGSGTYPRTGSSAGCGSLSGAGAGTASGSGRAAWLRSRVLVLYSPMEDSVSVSEPCTRRVPAYLER